jgi:hypothetical protein
MHLLYLLSLLGAPEVLRVYTKPIEPSARAHRGAQERQAGVAVAGEQVPQVDR